MISLLELLQVSLYNKEKLSENPSSQDWVNLYKESEKQAVLGIVLCGIEKLPQYQRPSQELLLQWIGAGEIIRQQNNLAYEKCVDLARLLTKDGRRYCILKGQGNALLYPNKSCRSTGDIDVWIEGGKKTVVEYVHGKFPNINVEYHHMQFPVFEDLEVEVHYYPTFCYNKIHNRRLQNYFKKSGEKQFCNYVEWENSEEKICVPNYAFNLVFQLSHMMRHFFTQGIGLRHAIDYYYLLNQDFDPEQIDKAIAVIKNCGMYKFMCAIMWIETDILGLQKNTDIAPKNEKVGRMVLNEMLKGGNFGKSYKHVQGGLFARYASEMIYRFRFIKEFPSEPIWRPFSLGWDYVKKRVWRFFWGK